MNISIWEIRINRNNQTCEIQGRIGWRFRIGGIRQTTNSCFNETSEVPEEESTRTMCVVNKNILWFWRWQNSVNKQMI
jgi:hypothetical protein